MHKLTMYEGLRDKIDKEIEDIDKVGITKDNLDHLYKLTMSLKAVDKHICLLEEEEMGGYSENRRYSRDGWNLRRTHDTYPYHYSRDAAKSKMIAKLETLKDDTMSDHERMAIQDCIGRISV